MLTGVNVGDFGKGSGETFFDLIRALDKVAGISRYRISSIEFQSAHPGDRKLGGEGIARVHAHFHIPLQSGSDEVLSLMRRRYGTGLFARRMKPCARELPDAFIGVDVIAGARGETPERWRDALRFIESLPVTRLSKKVSPGSAVLYMLFLPPSSAAPGLVHGVPSVAQAADYGRDNVKQRTVRAMFESYLRRRHSTTTERTLTIHRALCAASQQRGVEDNYAPQTPCRPSLPNQ